MVKEATYRLPGIAIKVLAGLAVIGALYFARQVLIPIAVALLLALLLGPVVEFFERWKLRRVPAVLLVVTLGLVLLGSTGFAVTSQVADLARNLPKYKNRIREKAASIGTPLGGLLDRAYNLLQDVGKPADLAGARETPSSEKDAVRVQIVQQPPTAWEAISYLLSSAILTLGAFALITILVVFLLIYHADLRDRIVTIFGVNRIPITTATINEAATSVSRYLLSQSAVNAVYGLLIGLSLLALGVPNAVLWGFLAAVLRFIPYVGPWLGFAPPFLLSLAVFDGWGRPLTFVLIVAALEFTIANILEPLLYGKRVGLSPLAIMVAAVFWTWLWGNGGLLLAVPLTVCLEVLGRHVPGLRFLSTLVAREPVVEAHHRFYHRMIGMNREDASEVVETARREKSILEVYDEIIIPALILADRDFQRGDLGEEEYDAALDGVEQILEDLELEPHPSEKAGSTAEAPSETPSAAEARLSLACIPASSRADELAGRMLAHVLSTRGVRVDILAAVAMTAEKAEQVERLDPDMACISTVTSAGRLQAWHLYKRIRRRRGDLTTIAGVWGTGEAADGFAARFGGDDKAYTAGSLARAGDLIAQLAPEILLRKAPAGRS